MGRQYWLSVSVGAPQQQGEFCSAEHISSIPLILQNHDNVSVQSNHTKLQVCMGLQTNQLVIMCSAYKSDSAALHGHNML